DWYVSNVPPSASPRQTSNLRFAVWLDHVRRVGADFAGLELVDVGVGDGGEVVGRRLALELLDLHLAVVALVDDDVDLAPLLALAEEVGAGVGAAALLPHQRGPGHGLGGDQQGLERQRLVPARVVLAGAVGLDLGDPSSELAQLVDALGELRALADDADVLAHDVLQLIVDHVGVLAGLAVERRGRPATRSLDLRDGGPGSIAGPVELAAGPLPGQRPEHD